ncbi:Membrane-associated protease RseP, regulator of RpoE activity [Auraticoccus monumenti]|uniref:Membrane-associated protease RseP, regulator of RpoE activity n=1 Tax=Auraticoccus monumenti TaxID=675864 RepID=A0A1G7D9X7_9ACTN|nr:Membrane-associated protease RseP, regulator of RpoE activity [Auraticoccus monumenti]
MVDVLVYVLAAVAFFALIMVSIGLHEVGHLVPAKLFGVKVTQFFTGFGRTLWSTRRGETEYGVKAIPLGGFVRMVGMFPPARDGSVRSSSSGIVQSLADSAREAEHEDITPADDGRLFYQKPVWQKVVVMAAGPVMNLLLAFLILLAVTGLHGVLRPQLVVSAVSECVLTAQEAQQRACTAADPPTPAAAMGLREGDRLVSFNGVPLRDWDQMSGLIRANRDRSAIVVVERDGVEQTLPSTSTVVNGVADQWNPSRTVEAGFLGVSPTYEQVRGGPVTVLADMGDMTVRSLHALARFPVNVWYTAVNLVTGVDRDRNGPISIVGASRVAGEIATTPVLTPGEKVATWFTLLGSVNLFVAIFNFVPLLPLDGGHIAGALWEGLRRGLARLLGRRDPGHVDTARLLPVAYVVGGFIAVSGVVLILADLIDPIRLLG